MEEIITIETKHIFIDIVNYTLKRSVEAQSDIIKSLNSIVMTTITDLVINKEEIIFIPTGDGMCISLINIKYPYDIHMKVAILLLKKIESYNITQVDEMRKFNIRIGINENIDNLIIDINERKNISGAGINLASRIEGLADFNQILVGQSVYDKLVNREKYMNSFKPYIATVKHGHKLNVFQFIDNSLSSLNNATPSIFLLPKNDQQKLDEFAAFYIALCIRNKEFILSKANDTLDVSTLHSMIYLTVLDEIGKSQTTKTKPHYTKRIEGIDDTTFNEFKKSNIWLKHEICYTLIPFKLNQFRNCFSEVFLLINNNGKNRLKIEKPEIYKKYRLK